MNARFCYGLAALIIGLLLCAKGIGFLLSPITYKATAQIKIETDFVHDGVATYETSAPYDPYFIETEFKAIESETVLSSVVRTLKLDEVWGKRYNHGEALFTEPATGLLRQRLEIDADRNTKLVDISVWDEDPDLAARMANGIGEAYKDYRQQQYRKEMAAGIEILKENYQKEAGEITNIQAQLEQMRKQLNLTNPEPSDDVLKSSYPAYFQAKQALKDKENLHGLLKAKIEADENDATIPRQVLVEMINPADPAHVGKSRNRQLGLIWLGCGVVLSGFGFYLLGTAGGDAGRERDNPTPVR